MNSDKRFPQLSDEHCRYLLIVYRLARWQKQIDAYPLQDDTEPTIEEIEAFVRKCKKELSDAE